MSTSFLLGTHTFCLLWSCLHVLVSNPLKALKPKAKAAPEKVSQKQFDETEPVKLLDEAPESVPGRRSPGKAGVKEKTPEKVSEKVLKPEKSVGELPKKVPEKIPEKPPEKVPEEPVKVPQRVAEEHLVTEKQPSEEAKLKKPAEQRVPIKKAAKVPDKVPEAKAKGRSHLFVSLCLHELTSSLKPRSHHPEFVAQE